MTSDWTYRPTGGISTQRSSDGIYKSRIDRKPLHLTSPSFSPSNYQERIEKISCSNSESLGIDHWRKLARALNISFQDSDETAELCERVKKFTGKIFEKTLAREEKLSTSPINQYDDYDDYPITPEEFKKHSCINLAASGRWNRDYLRDTARRLNIDFQDSYEFDELCKHMKNVLTEREEEKFIEESLYPSEEYKSENLSTSNHQMNRDFVYYPKLSKRKPRIVWMEAKGTPKKIALCLHR